MVQRATPTGLFVEQKVEFGGKEVRREREKSVMEAKTLLGRGEEMMKAPVRSSRE